MTTAGRRPATYGCAATGVRSAPASGCPGSNSLANHPELAAQFDIAANGGRTPDQVVAGTHEKLWWVCPVADDHRWPTTGKARTGRGDGCPACAGQQVSVTNSLANHPELAAQFDVERNGRTAD